MERAAGLTRDDAPPTKLDKLDAVLAQTSTSIEDAALFAEMLSLPNDGRYPALDLTAPQRRQRTLEALVSQVQALTRQNPVLMIFEDAHWNDPTSLEAFGRTVDRIAGLRALLIVTFRPEFNGPWIGRPHAGGPEKARQCLEEFGYDAAIEYKGEGDLDEVLRRACPDGVDVYFDNTSGSISDAVLRNLALGARIVICGTASYPSWNPWNTGPRPERHLLVKRARMQGFLATDFMDRFPEAEARISRWIREGRVNYREEMHEGLEHAPGSLQRLYKGENTGKFVIRLPAARGRANT
jgi:hypothetical protein